MAASTTKTDPSTVSALNAARAAAVKNGGDPYAGNLKDYNTFSASGTGSGTGSDDSGDDDGGFSRLDTGSLYGNSDENKARSVLYDVSDFDEAGARSAAIQGASAQLEGINSTYDAKVADERKLGQTDLARSNTISALTGFTGSPEGATRAGEADRRTQDRVDTVNSERQTAIASIYSAIDANVMQEKEAHLATQHENASNLLAEVATNAKSILNKFAAQGVSWDKLAASDPDTLDKLVQQTGEDAFSLRQLYNSELGTPPKELYSGWKGDNYVQVEQDPTTGAVTSHTYTSDELGIPKGTNLGTVTVGGKVYWYDQDAPLDSNGQPKLILVGSSGAGGSDGIDLTADDKRTLLGVSFNASDISDLQKSVNEFGLDSVITNGGFTDAQNTALRKVYGGSDSDTTKLTRENVAKLYGITDDDTGTSNGFFGLGAAKSGKSQLDDIMASIGRYQAIGMSDDKIMTTLGIGKAAE